MARVSGRSAAVFGGTLFIICLAAALSVDVVKTGFGLKGDEATYVSTGLSAAFDYDLTYERRDLERFFGLYRSGPDGIFLKRGKRQHLQVDAIAPFVHITTTPDLRSDRLYFGKALLYGVLASPFVRLFGLNGFLVFHVVLLFSAAACPARFRRAFKPGSALLFTAAFVSQLRASMVFIAPRFAFSLVALAYFCGSIKKYRPLRQPASALARKRCRAAFLLGTVICSSLRTFC
jgi:hypothetical protein